MIILFCGISGSGKTTIAGILAARLAALGQVQIFSSDRFRPPVYSKLFEALARNRRRADFTILDATFYKKEWRRGINHLAEGEEVVTIYLDCPLEVALQRNRDRWPNIDQRAVHIMFHQMERPENPTLTIDTERTSAAESAQKILELVSTPELEPHAGHQ